VEDQVRRLYQQAESDTARAWEEVVHRNAFGELLARMTENVMGLTRISNDAFDLFVRNMRVAGRSDVTRLATQLARTEDKLELVLQEVERLQDELQALRSEQTPQRADGADATPARGGARRGPT
jgi:hypothetical protein